MARVGNDALMGIRYYAYPITSEQYPAALENPCPFHGDDPLMDAWGDPDDAPEMLYLDKCWRELQVLLGPKSGIENRPALQLVDGSVTDTPTGWIPYERALSPAEVHAIAGDLATVGESDIRRLMPLIAWRGAELEEGEYEYIAQYLAAAQEFTQKLAREGRGLVYLIG